jgi:hypothetical protein
LLPLNVKFSISVWEFGKVFGVDRRNYFDKARKSSNHLWRVIGQINFLTHVNAHITRKSINCVAVQHK